MAIPSTEAISAVLSKQPIPTPQQIDLHLGTPQLQQTMGTKSFADFAPPDAANVPAHIQEGIKRMALYDPNGNIVPKKVQYAFVGGTSLSRDRTTPLQKTIRPVSGQGPESLAVTDTARTIGGVSEAYNYFLGLVPELPSRILAGVLSHSSNPQTAARATAEGNKAPTSLGEKFTDVFSSATAGTPLTKGVPYFAGIASMVTDPMNFLTGPEGGLIVRELTAATTVERAGEILARAKVPKDLADAYAAHFAALKDPAQVQAGVDSLIKTLETTKMMAEAEGHAAQTLETLGNQKPTVAPEIKANAEKIAEQLGVKAPEATLPTKTTLEIQHADKIAATRAEAAAIPETIHINTPERDQLRSDIATRLYGEGATVKARRADIVLGLPAAGKSDKIANVLRDAHGSLIVDSDLAKELSPEFKNGLGAGALHKESDIIAKDLVLRHAMNNGDNVVLPLVGRNRANIKAIIDDLYSKGYDVHLHHNDLALEKSIDRAITRYLETGRFVDPNYIRGIGLTPQDTYATLKGYGKLKGYSQASNDVAKGERPLLIEEKNSGLPQERFQLGGKNAQGKRPQVLENARGRVNEKAQIEKNGGISSDRAQPSQQVLKDARGRDVGIHSGQEKITIKDRIPVPKTLSETAARDVNFVRALSAEKLTGPVKDLIKPQFPHLTDTTITVFAKRLAQLTRESDIEGLLSSLQRLDNQTNETGQRILDATMPTSVRSALTPRQAQLTVDQLAREIKTPENAAIAEAEYGTLWEHADQRIIDRFNEANIERGILEDVVADHPGKFFTQFRLPGQSWSDFRLDEALVRGMKTGGKGKNIDIYLSEHGFDTLEEAQKGLEDYLAMKQQIRDVKGEISELRPKVRSAQIVRGMLDELPVVPNGRVGAIDELANTADVRSTYRDISGFAGGFRDLYRNFEHFFGPRFPDIKTSVLDPFDAAKGEYVDLYNKLGDEIGANVVEKYGIKRGSEADKAIQDWGERDLMASPATANPESVYHTEEALVAKFGPERAREIQAADAWFRNKYTQLITEINDVRKKIYPNNPAKLIPFRKDYYRHFREVGDSMMDAVRSFMDVPSGIDPKLVGVSEFTKPKSKWLAFAQQRLGPISSRGAIGGFLDYAPAAAYAIKIDPQIGVFRYLRRKLADVAPIAGTTENNSLQKGIDNFLQFLDDFSNNLATKTNPVDRWIQKRIPGGRRAMKAIEYVNNRVKANTILGNLGASFAQIANIPQGIASAKLYSLPGMQRTLASLFTKNTAAAGSTFLKERYLTTLRDRFTRDFGTKPIRASTELAARQAAHLMRLGDLIGTHFIWNSHYAKALAEGMTDPVKYADGITRKLVAGRGIGELPVDQQAKITQLLAPFTVEVQNLWWILKDQVKARDFAGLATLLVANYLFNEVSQKTRGNRIVYDPINALVEGAATLGSEIKAGRPAEGAAEFIGRQLGEVLSNVPGGQLATSVVPDQMFGIKKANVFGQGDPNRFGSPVLLAGAFKDWPTAASRLLPPFGGAQIKKTWDGIHALMQGEVAKGGKTSFPIAWTPANFVRASLFGPSATAEGQDLYNGQDKLRQQITAQDAERQQLAAEAEAEWGKLKDMRASQGADAVAAEWKKISTDNPELLTRLKTIAADDEKGITAKDRLILQLGVANGARARYIVDQLQALKTKEEKQQLWLDYAKKKILTKDVAAQATKLLEGETVKSSAGTTHDVGSPLNAPEIATPSNPLLGNFADFSKAQNTKKEALKLFPFTDQARAVIDQARVGVLPRSERVGGIQGEQRRKGNDYESFVRGLMSEKAANFIIDHTKFLQKLDHANIDIRTTDPEILGHEMLHQLFDNSPMSGINPDLTPNANAQAFGERFSNDFNESAKTNPDLRDINNHIEATYDTANMSGEEYATEQFAYLGENVIRKGVGAIPKPLQKYYSWIFRTQ
jgi:hypothetical protein